MASRGSLGRRPLRDHAGSRAPLLCAGPGGTSSFVAMGGVLEIIRIAVVALRSKRGVVATGLLGPAIAAWSQLPHQMGIRPQQPGPPRVDGNAGGVAFPGRDRGVALARLSRYRTRKADGITVLRRGWNRALHAGDLEGRARPQPIVPDVLSSAPRPPPLVPRPVPRPVLRRGWNRALQAGNLEGRAPSLPFSFVPWRLCERKSENP
jgi:hypothetical protein